MRNPPGDVGPGRRTLGQHQLGDIVDRDHVAVLGFGCLFAGDAHGIISLLPVARHRQLSLDKPLVAASRRVEDFRKFRRDFRKR